MVISRFKVKCKPDKTEQAMAAFQDIVNASRPLVGVISFDMGRDILDPNSFLALEVYEDRAALERQEALPEVKKVMGFFEEIAAGEPEYTIFHVSSSESPEL